jgi:peptidoglycan/xylan/chitin deacetylase (PgdA/CDA1 family)
MHKFFIYSILYIEDFGQEVTKMTRIRRLRRKKHIRKYFIAFIVIFSLFFIKTSYKYSQKTASNIVEAKDLSESILLMSEKSAVNMALQHEKKLIEEEKARLEKEKRDKLEANKNKKIVYLTFDDGPSDKITPQILDILKEYDVKATFFVIGNLAEIYPNLIKRIHEEGHGIGNHSYSHQYKHIYSSTINFLSELKTTEKVLKNILGEEYETKIIRFPGGSFGKKKAAFRKAAVDNGYSYYDWNSLNGDAEGHNISKNRLVDRFKSTSKGKKQLIVLMHDINTKKTTVEALPEIIEYLQQNDYEFDILK